MLTTLPDRHTMLGHACIGKEFGHVSGHQYHDVEVLVSWAKAPPVRVHIVESWGSAQGCDEELGRRSYVARADDVPDACDAALRGALMVGMHESYLRQAVSLAEDQAYEQYRTPAEYQK